MIISDLTRVDQKASSKFHHEEWMMDEQETLFHPIGFQFIPYLTMVVNSVAGFLVIFTPYIYLQGEPVTYTGTMVKISPNF